MPPTISWHPILVVISFYEIDYSIYTIRLVGDQALRLLRNRKKASFDKKMNENLWYLDSNSYLDPSRTFSSLCTLKIERDWDGTRGVAIGTIWRNRIPSREQERNEVNG